MRRSPEAIARWNQAVAAARAVAAGTRIQLDNIFPLDPDARDDIAPGGPCPFLGQEAWVSATGRFDPCCAPDAQRRTLGEFGDLHEQGLMQIWHGDAYQRLRTTYRNHSLCLGCNMRKPVETPMIRWYETPIAADGTHHLLEDVRSTPTASTRCSSSTLPASPPCAAPARPGTSARTARRLCPPLPPHLRVLRAHRCRHGPRRLAPHHRRRRRPLPRALRLVRQLSRTAAAPCADTAGDYHHITAEGQPAYDERWRYAGDYRDGSAVVQRADGRSTHIDDQGRPLHGRWFLDLDVFHKGFARARDESGWMHVDRTGRPIYARRFAAVEPFYNGQARVERHDGGLEIIDEAAHSLVELRPALRSEFHALSADIVGAWRTDTLAVTVELHLIQLPSRTTPLEIAMRCGITLDGATRLLRALAELGVVTRARDDLWHPTERGAHLREDHPQTLADAAREAARPQRASWSNLAHALRDGEWYPSDIFREVATSPARAASHNRMLRSYARHDYTPIAAHLPLPHAGVIVDAGGGLGVLADLVAAQRPETSVVLLERPEVVEQLPVQRRFAAVSADLFAPWPIAADVILLTRVLHDWDDDQALTLLHRAREALNPGGQLMIVELLLDPENPGGGLCDLHLRVVTGGRERTLADFAALLRRAGLHLTRHERASSLLHTLTATHA